MDREGPFQIRFGGSGGQGVVLASRILGDALCREGFNVLQTQSYGIEARGGASCGEVLYGASEINALKVSIPDVLVALTADALALYAPSVRPGGLVFYDSYTVHEAYEDGGRRVYAAPFTDLSLTAFDSDLYTNIVALGFVNALSGIVGRGNLEDAVAEQAPARKTNNAEALRIGYREALKIRDR